MSGLWDDAPSGPIGGCPEPGPTDVHPPGPEPVVTAPRLAAMQDPRPPHVHRSSSAPRPWHAIGALLAVALLATACSSAGGGASAVPPATASSSPSAPPASVDPESPVATEPGASGGTIGGPGDQGFVVPKPGQLDVKPIRADALAATVDGRHVVLTITWTSGVEPCYVLDSIVVDQGDHAYAITLREGHGPQEVMCIQIAEVHRTQVDLGDLPSGTYTISDSQGGAAPIEVTVP